MSEKSHFENLAAINVNDKIEKKNNLSYLSWAWAVDQLLRADPSATWEYCEPAKFGETLMVFCKVTAFGKSMTAQLPVMDYKNKAVANPDAFAVNTAMQRCLAKAIALHGLGLYIYAGEDLPLENDEPKKPPSGSAAEIKHDAYESLDVDGKAFIDNLAVEVVDILGTDGAPEAIKYINVKLQNTDLEWRNALWHRLDSKTRTALKAKSQVEGELNP